MKRQASHPLTTLVEQQKGGRPAGLASICSANRFVIEAAMRQAAEDGTAVLIESTSNQVDQFGGYTGMTPAEFVVFVHDAADRVGFPRERLILGGDHLGPNAWQKEDAERAMSMARDLVHAYVSAGFTKIHLDASMSCADDGGGGDRPLSPDVVAGRAVDLCSVAESAAAEPGVQALPRYVIGTEVPTPGGAREQLSSAPVTTKEHARQTIELTRQAFLNRDLAAAWDRVIAVVVQPGVEFGDDAVIDYDRRRAAALSGYIETVDGLVYEAHSTDYQKPEPLKQMVEDHFAVLKVGPWLTFAMREAIFALARIEEEGPCGRKGVTPSGIREALEQAMLAHPQHWQRHYHGDDFQKQIARKYSYSDRSRYYWPYPAVQKALQELLANLSVHPPPLTLLSQVLPNQYHAVRGGRITNTPDALINDKIMEVTSIYAFACGYRSTPWRTP